jgi:hypothetical protein
MGFKKVVQDLIQSDINQLDEKVLRNKVKDKIIERLYNEFLKKLGPDEVENLNDDEKKIIREYCATTAENDAEEIENISKKIINDSKSDLLELKTIAD